MFGEKALSAILYGTAWWSFFNAIRFGTIDPHNTRRTLRRLYPGIQASLALLAFAGLQALQPKSSDLALFLAMFVFAQVVAVPFTAPDVYTPDEEPNALKLWLQQRKSALGGAILLKIVAGIVAFATEWAIGYWWFTIILAFGCVLAIGRAVTARQLVAGGEGEYGGSSAQEREAEIKAITKLTACGCFAYALAGAFIQVGVFVDCAMDPWNLTGWAGLLCGSVLHWVRS